MRSLINDGYSLVIYPEGGRSPDGWGQDFKGGAAYMSARTGAPVIPVFIDGTGAIFGKGMKRPKPGRTKVVFGAPLRPEEGESTRRFNARIEAAVTTLGDEAITDFWTARQRAARGTNPALTGPEYTGWRRDWALTERRKLGHAGLRRRQQRRWPNLN
jgi:1-acyl-sn-glycerol-3-phosphate acyltransferase